MSMTKSSHWKPLPPVGYPTLAQRVAAIQLATRSHSSSSSSSSSSSTRTPKAKVVVRRGYAIPLPRNDQLADKEDDTIPTMVTIPTATTTMTMTTTFTKMLSRDDDDEEEEEDDDKSLLHYKGDKEELEKDNSSLDDDNDNDNDNEDDNFCWEYDDLEDIDNDSVEKVFKESQRPRFMRARNQDLYPRDDGNVTTTITTTPSISISTTNVAT